MLLQARQSPSRLTGTNGPALTAPTGAGLCPLSCPRPQADQRYLGSQHGSAHPERPLPAGPLAGAASGASAQLKLAGQQRGRGCISFTTRRALGSQAKHICAQGPLSDPQVHGWRRQGRLLLPPPPSPAPSLTPSCSRFPPGDGRISLGQA